MKIKTHIKCGTTNAGGYGLMNSNHNETLVRDKSSKGLKVKTRIKAGTVQAGFGVQGANHNETLVHGKASKGLKVKTRIKAGTISSGGFGLQGSNHNETLVSAFRKTFNVQR